jgi:hypothetical protein
MIGCALPSLTNVTGTVRLSTRGMMTLSTPSKLIRAHLEKQCRCRARTDEAAEQSGLGRRYEVAAPRSRGRGQRVGGALDQTYNIGSAPLALGDFLRRSAALDLSEGVGSDAAPKILCLGGGVCGAAVVGPRKWNTFGA